MTVYLRKFANWIGWGALGAFIGIAALVLAFNVTKPDVRMFILSDTNLVDVKTQLNDLALLYNGKDLIKEHLALHLYRVQVQNIGNTILRKDDFDDSDLWGIRVSAGKIVKIGGPISDSTYIRKNLSIKIDTAPDQATLLFTPIIFEPGDSFIVDFFVLMDASSQPSSLTSVGKIAGIRQIPVTALNLYRPSLLYEAYWGDWEVLVLRVLAAPVYIILFGLCIWGIVGPIIFAKSRLRRRQINKALIKNGLDLTNPTVIAIKEQVNLFGIDSLDTVITTINSILSGKIQTYQKEEVVSGEILEKLIRSRVLIRSDKGKFNINPDPSEITAHPGLGLMQIAAPSPEEEMLSSGVLSKEDEKFKVADTAVRALTALAKEFGQKIPNIGVSEGEVGPD
jgi:hypothetical protein